MERSGSGSGSTWGGGGAGGCCYPPSWIRPRAPSTTRRRLPWGRSARARARARSSSTSCASAAASLRRSSLAAAHAGRLPPCRESPSASLRT